MLEETWFFSIVGGWLLVEAIKFVANQNKKSSGFNLEEKKLLLDLAERHTAAMEQLKLLGFTLQGIVNEHREIKQSIHAIQLQAVAAESQLDEIAHKVDRISDRMS